MAEFPKKRIRNGLVIALGVAITIAFIGRELWLATPADETEVEELVEQGESLSLSLQEQLDADIAELATDEAQARRESPLGQALMTQCVEWGEFHENFPDETSEQNRDEACDRFNQYVETGVDPRAEP